MKLEEFSFIGTIIKTKGISGEVLADFENFSPKKLKDKESVFLMIDELLVPFFIDFINPVDNKSAFLRFDDFLSDVAAKEIVGLKMYLPVSKNLGREAQDEKGVLEGYRFFDRTSEKEGVVVAIIENKTNPILEVSIDDELYLLPFHADLIVSVDHKKQEIVFDAPDGIFDINN